MSTTLAPRRTADETRRTILRAAFREFQHHGFQGGSLARIVEGAGITKGALFHHFGAKQELGYAVVDEIVGPLLQERWLGALVDTADPIGDMQRAFRRYVRADIDSGSWLHGCPLNNLAQEMSPLDEEFRTRIDALYASWRAAVAEALERGIAAGTVRGDVAPNDVAALVVAGQMGVWGTGKYSRNADLMVRSGEALCRYLESLRA